MVSNKFSNNTGYYLNTNNKYLLSVLNSKLINFYYRTISAQIGEKGVRCFTIYIQNIPIPKLPEVNQQPFSLKAERLISLNKELCEPYIISLEE